MSGRLHQPTRPSEQVSIGSKAPATATPTLTPSRLMHSSLSSSFIYLMGTYLLLSNAYIIDPSDVTIWNLAGVKSTVRWFR